MRAKVAEGGRMGGWGEVGGRCGREEGGSKDAGEVEGGRKMGWLGRVVHQSSMSWEDRGSRSMMEVDEGVGG